MEHIWQRTSLSRKQFAWLYGAPLERYAELVQNFPASESHHHAYHGGMLDHGLEIVAYALKLRQSYLLPAGASPEDQSAQAEAWTAAAAYAALLHDIGKVAVDLRVEQADGTTWHPWHGPLRQPHRFRYRENREYRLHSAATGLVYHQLLDCKILDWLSEYPEMWASLLYVLAGQYEHAGTLGELVVQADRASVAQELGGDPARAMAAPKHALQRKLLDGLRYLLKHELKLNQPEASDGWLTEDALWLVSKTVSDKLRAHLLSLGIEGIPANNTAVFNVLQDHGMLQPTPDDKAIWRATVTSTNGWSHGFTLLRLSPALIWESTERPDAFSGTITVDAVLVDEDSTTPSTPSAQHSEKSATSKGDSPLHTVDAETVMHQPFTKVTPSSDPMEELLSIIEVAGPMPASKGETATSAPAQKKSSHHSGETAPETLPIFATYPSTLAGPISAEHFVNWLKISIASRKLLINDAKALVHTVSDTVYLVSPGIFQRYVQEHPEVTLRSKQDQVPDWEWIQKRFEKLQLHRKQESGLNIWTCTVTGPRKSRRLHGYLLIRPDQVFDDLPPNNPYLALTDAETASTR